MTNEDTVRRWMSGSKDALESAELLLEEGKHALAVFMCHLAVEKALKGCLIAQKNTIPPHTHNLLEIALELDTPWTEAEQKNLRQLSGFAVAARYDELWEDEVEASENVQWWIETTKSIINHFDNV